MPEEESSFGPLTPTKEVLERKRSRSVAYCSYNRVVGRFRATCNHAPNSVHRGEEPRSGNCSCRNERGGVSASPCRAVSSPRPPTSCIPCRAMPGLVNFSRMAHVVYLGARASREPQVFRRRASHQGSRQGVSGGVALRADVGGHRRTRGTCLLSSMLSSSACASVVPTIT